jgi:branched-chain amino acid transport system permease protein
MILGELDYLVFFAVVALTFALHALGLNLQWGFTGLFNVGVAGFAAIGAYTSAILTGPAFAGSLGGFGLPVLVGWAASMLTSAAAALLIGALTLRLRQDYLAIATFGVAVVIQLLALNLEWLTGGAFGLASLPRPLSGWAETSSSRNLLFLLILAVIVVSAWAALRLLTAGPWGRVLRAIREDETAARALGKSPLRHRLEAFALGSALMGLGGAVYASFIGFVAPQDFQAILTFQVWAMLIVGGAGRHGGAILGAVLVWAIWTASGTLLDALLPDAFQVRGAALQVVLIGTALVVILLVRPKGLLAERLGRDG